MSEKSLNDPASFTASTYALEWMYRHKNLYAVGVNTARNVALALGRQHAQWTLPWDGACFVTPQAWDGIRQLSRQDSAALHLVVPLARVSDPQSLLSGTFKPARLTEPQLGFRHDSEVTFDEQLRYGNRNKAELLVRLGISGPWNNWHPAAWDRPQPVPCAERGRFVQGGWVARLPAGCESGIENDEPLRWRSRFQGVALLCRQLDTRILIKHNKKGRLLCYNEAALRNVDHATVQQLSALADIELARPAPSVLDKSHCAPSANRQDYFSVAPYFHHDQSMHREQSTSAVHYLDGVRNAYAIAGTTQSGEHDRHALDRMIQGVCTTTLAGVLAPNPHYLARAALLVRTWFIDPASRMNPHMRFAQCIPNAAAAGRPWGIVEFRNLWPVLDAMTLLRRAGALSAQEFASLQHWFGEFLDDVTRHATALEDNNIAIWSDLLTASIAAFLGRHQQAATILADVPLRMSTQLLPFAVPHRELQRSRPLHYSLFLAQGLACLAWLGRSLGMDLWRYQATQHRSVALLIRFLALNRELFSDYAAEAVQFDYRIASLIQRVPADAAGFSALQSCRDETSTLPVDHFPQQPSSALADSLYRESDFGMVPFFFRFGPD
ncbi:MAG TPA: alginate lyase family protein [Dongiaceae bacterium]|nr:alginate lyase family protein [Dongiaceae bacterium]